MTRAAAPAEYDNARLGSLDPRSNGRDDIGVCQKTLGRRWDFGDLASHRAAGVRFNHRRLWSL